MGIRLSGGFNESLQLWPLARKCGFLCLDGIETHNALLGAGIWVIEGLNLGKIKPGKYELNCLPLKVLNSDGAPARALLR